MKVKSLIQILQSESGFFAGVPDSQIKPLCNYLMNRFGISEHHIIAANEGNCAALAAGYHLATGKTPVVYMQNSGIGNAINPYASLLNNKVYGIPCIFIIGWRGEPNTHDEPQHVFQGEITLKLLEELGIKTFIITKNTTEEELQEKMLEFKPALNSGVSIAFVVCKGALETDAKVEYTNSNKMSRETAIERIVSFAGEDIIISTTGKTSRELFEVREANQQTHKYDFLTVGSMGHSSSIALGIALQLPQKRIWCIDGDGAAIMHMGAMATIGAHAPKNMIHVVVNNGAHESVGGMPTVANKVDFGKIARGCAYPNTACATDIDTLNEVIKKAKSLNELSFIEVKTSIGSRANLGRPTIPAKENKANFMKYLMECKQQ